MLSAPLLLPASHPSSIPPRRQRFGSLRARHGISISNGSFAVTKLRREGEPLPWAVSAANPRQELDFDAAVNIAEDVTQVLSHIPAVNAANSCILMFFCHCICRITFFFNFLLLVYLFSCGYLLVGVS